MTADSAQAAALAALDKALAAKPEPDHAAFAETAQHLSALRNQLAAEIRQSGGGRRDLDHVNAVISIVLAGHFPLGGIPWPDLEQARGWLAAVGTAR